MDRLINELKEQQRKLGMSDEAFAAFLGVSRATWVMTRQGQGVGLSLLAGVARRFPGLKDEVFSAVAGYRTGQSVAS